MSVADYFTQIKKLWDDYNGLISIPHCSCRVECASLIAAYKLIRDQQLIQFFIGLNDDYTIARGSILMMKPLADIDQVDNIILQEEKQRALTALSQFNSSSAAFNASNHDKVEHSVFVVQQRLSNSGFHQDSTISTTVQGTIFPV